MSERTGDRNREISSERATVSALILVSIVGLAGMFAEGIALEKAGIPRHDSMYVLLLPVVYVLLRLLTQVKVRSFSHAGEMSQWIYILHPTVIVAVRGSAGAMGIDALLVGHSLVHYLAVCAMSITCSIALIHMKVQKRVWMVK